MWRYVRHILRVVHANQIFLHVIRLRKHLLLFIFPFFRETCAPRACLSQKEERRLRRRRLRKHVIYVKEKIHVKQIKAPTQRRACACVWEDLIRPRGRLDRRHRREGLPVLCVFLSSIRTLANFWPTLRGSFSPLSVNIRSP